MAFERITSDSQRRGGVQCIRDFRVKVSTVLGRLAGGASVEEILAEFPYLDREDVAAALEFAAEVVNEHEVPFGSSCVKLRRSRRPTQTPSA